MPLHFIASATLGLPTHISNTQDHPLTPPESSYACSSGQLQTKRPATSTNQVSTSAISRRAPIARSVSCSVVEPANRTPSRCGSRMNISYEDEALCLRSSENVYRLFEDATSSPINGSDNSRLLARKALRYRNLLERVDQADLSDSTFDVTDFCGVAWHKRA